LFLVLLWDKQMSGNTKVKVDAHQSVYLGSRLRILRQERGLNIAQMASAVGVTSGLISQVENGLADPSLTTLRSISKVLRIPMFYFFVNEKLEPKVRSSKERYLLNSQDGKVRYEFISDPDDAQVEFTMIRAKPGAASGDKQDRHPGRECALVLAGRMILEIEDNIYELNTTDSIAFDSLRPHRWVNAGNAELRFTSVTSWAFSEK
jgi:transcriptional regulator with XRE-family HTH domain